MSIALEDKPAALDDIPSLTGYLKNYGRVLARKAIRSLRPLHVPGKDPLPDFDEYQEDRTPLEAQQHVAAAAIKAIDKHGAAFVIGEPGCGKTITSIAAIHEHAMRSRRKGGFGGKYRCIVLCPDTLINKWKEEIETTVPDVKVITLKKWSDILDVIGEPKTHRKSKRKATVKRTREVASVSDQAEFAKAVKARDWETARSLTSTEQVSVDVEPTEHQDRKRWPRDWNVEWLILGRDQIKLGASFSGLGSKRRGFDFLYREQEPHRLVEVDRKNVTDKDGVHVYKPGTWTPVTKGVYEKRLCCPRCGKLVADDKGRPLASEKLSKAATTCNGRVLAEVTKTGYGNDRLYESMNYTKYKGFGDETFPNHARRVKIGTRISHAGKSWEVQECGEPLFQYHRKPDKWPAANIVQRKLRRWANYLIVDEAHQMKGEGSAQAIAMGKVLSTTRYCLALTGTLIGGYADHLFPLLLRMAGAEMKERGFQWGSKMPFVERYGCIDRILSGTVPVSTSTKAGSSRSLAKKIGQVNETREARPGIMPTLFSHIVMKRAIFLKLDQFIDNLPGFEEKMRSVEMDSDIQLEYNRIANILEAECSKMLATGNMKLLGAMLWTLLSYPDCPFDWAPRFPGDHAVGWWRRPKVYTPENYVGVVTPSNFDQDRILPKEKALIDLCKSHADKNEQTWVYTLLTKVHSPGEHLVSALEKEGLRVGVLKSDDATPRERLNYINKVGRTVDVMISHPGLVATGMDLFNYSKGNHNFNNLAFFQTGYDLFTLRQASRRAWRIGQEKDCTVNYFFYLGTMPAAAMQLMSRKMLAALQLEEGSISEEGLAAMSAGSDQTALINAISNVVDPRDIERNWGKTSGGTGKKKLKKVVVEKPAITEGEDGEWHDATGATIDDPAEYLNNEGDNDEEVEDASEFEVEQTAEVDEFDELTESDMNFDDDDLSEMFASMEVGESDELDWD